MVGQEDQLQVEVVATMVVENHQQYHLHLQSYTDDDDDHPAYLFFFRLFFPTHDLCLSRGSKICVSVRKRPINAKETENNESDVVEVSTDHSLTVHEPKFSLSLSMIIPTLCISLFFFVILIHAHSFIRIE